MSTDSLPVGVQSASGVPLFPLGTVLFPGGLLPLRIFEPRYVDMVRRCMREQTPFGVLLILTGSEVGARGAGVMSQIGTTARIVDFNTLPDGLLGIACRGDRKFRVLKHWQQPDGLHVGDLEFFAPEDAVPWPARLRDLADWLRRALAAAGDLYADVPENFADVSWVSFRLAELLPLTPVEKQRCLELCDPLARLARLNQLVRQESE